MGKKNGGIELLAEEHFSQQNPWGQTVVGWQPTSQGIGGLHNPRGYAILRVVLTKLAEEKMVPLYDQPVIVENAGSIIIAQLGQKIGLVKNFRMVGERILPDAAAMYIKQLNENYLWEELVNSLGQWKLEAPRGLIPLEVAEKGETKDIEKFILKTAKIESLQEAGFRITNAKVMGKVNPNSTFFVHSQWVVYAKIEGVEKSRPENLEIIGNSKLYSLDELRELNRSGEFDDGLTLAAMAMCGLSLR